MIYLTCQPFLATYSDLHPSLGAFPVGSHHQLTVTFLRSVSASEAMWHKSEVQSLALSLTNYAVLGNSLASLCLSFLICKVGTIIPFSEGCCEEEIS